jgi:hypothetical protein
MLRIPDLYSFFLTKHKVLDVLELDITNSEIASYISNFFNHKNELDIVAYFKGIEQPIFSQNDILILHDIRTVLDNMIIIAIICFIILLFCSVYLLKQASIREIRQAVHISTVFGLILAGFASFSIFFSPIRRKILNVLSNGLSKNTDLLIEFFKDDYYQLLGILVFIGNIILLFLILSFVRKRTKQTSLFKTTLEGVDKLKYNNSSSN